MEWRDGGQVMGGGAGFGGLVEMGLQISRWRRPDGRC